MKPRFRAGETVVFIRGLSSRQVRVRYCFLRKGKQMAKLEGVRDAVPVKELRGVK